MIAVLLLGCATSGDVVVTGVPAFGDLRSAAWGAPDPIERRIDLVLGGEPAAYEIPSGERDGFVRLDAVGDACEAERAELEPWAEASAAFAASWDPAEPATLCPAIGPLLADLAAAEPGGPPERQLRIGYCTGDPCSPGPIPEGAWTLATPEPGEDAEVRATLTYGSADAPPYWASILDAWDDASCTLDRKVLPAGFSTEEVWSVEGTLEVGAVREGTLAGTLTGDLVDADGTVAGTVDARFSAARCAVEDAVVYVLVGI